MIISLRGSNGSGKSTTVRRILNQCPDISAMMLPNKRKPVGYICDLGARKLFVPGHYEIANGGIDTIGDLELAYKLIVDLHSFGADVLYEGMNLSDNISQLKLMAASGIDVRVVFINCSLNQCIKSVRQRGHKIQEKTITNIYNKCARQYEALQGTKIQTFLLNRKSAQLQIQQWLGVNNENRSNSKCLPSVIRNNQLST